MPEGPTKEGQNLIIKNLNNIFVAVVITSVGYLFTWASTMSKNYSELKDQYDQVVVSLRAENTAIHAELDDVESDVKDLQLHTEFMHDDTRVRLTHIEDWLKFKQNWQ